MKKVIFIIIGIICACFLIPFIFTKGFRKGQEVSSNNIENVEENMIELIDYAITDYNYSEFNNINLLHKETGVVEEIALDEYLLGVVAAEMPADYEEEALKAQATVARTYTIYTIISNQKKQVHADADICDSYLCCQAWISKEDRMEKWDADKREIYWNKICKVVDATKGDIILYNGQIINALFHANSGGTTELPFNVWSSSGTYPYLQTVQTSGEEGYTQYASEVELSKDDFISKIKEKHTSLEIDFSKEDWFSVLEYTEGGRIKTIKIGNKELSGVEVRTIFGLKSANFKLTLIEDKIKFEVLGYGHGVRNESNRS